MKNNEQITKEDVVFFMDMIDFPISPNYKTKIYGRKTYYQLLKDRNSYDYKRFVRIYITMSNILNEREKLILDHTYIENTIKLKKVGQLVNLSPERVRQIRDKAEVKIARELLRYFKNDLIEGVKKYYWNLL